MNDNDNDDAAYYLSRGEQEDEVARKAVNPLAADIHRSLATRYRAKAGALDTCHADDALKSSLTRD